MPAEWSNRKEAGMRKVIALALAMGIIAASVPAEAGFGLRVRGGYSKISYGDFNDWADNFNSTMPSGAPTIDEIKWLPELDAEFTFSIVPTFSAGVGVGYLSGSSDFSWSLGAQYLSMKHTVRAIPIFFNVYWEPSLASFQPFIFAGAGMYRTDLEFKYGASDGFDELRYDSELDTWGFGLQGGGGLRFAFTPMVGFEVGLQGRWTDISGFEGTATDQDGTTVDVYLAKDEDVFGPESTDEGLPEGSVDLSGVTFFIGMTIAF